jgi:hypothetical protein
MKRFATQGLLVELVVASVAVLRLVCGRKTEIHGGCLDVIHLRKAPHCSRFRLECSRIQTSTKITQIRFDYLLVWNRVQSSTHINPSAKLPHHPGHAGALALTVIFGFSSSSSGASSVSSCNNNHDPLVASFILA